MIVACVRTGNKYPVEYVYKLRDMVARHLPIEHLFVCLTDRPKDFDKSIVCRDISKSNLFGWWGKMALFAPWWRVDERVLYFDLDSVICGSLLPLAELEVDFGICENFTRQAGNYAWPCKYGSCVMTIGPNKHGYVWEKFISDDVNLIRKAGQLGDQKVIEYLEPSATILQEFLPKGYFLGYRYIQDEKPEGASIVVFAGNSKPHNCNKEWIKREWARS